MEGSHRPAVRSAYQSRNQTLKFVSGKAANLVESWATTLGQQQRLVDSGLVILATYAIGSLGSKIQVKGYGYW